MQCPCLEKVSTKQWHLHGTTIQTACRPSKIQKSSFSDRRSLAKCAIGKPLWIVTFLKGPIRVFFLTILHFSFTVCTADLASDILLKADEKVIGRLEKVIYPLMEKALDAQLEQSTSDSTPKLGYWFAT